MEKGLPSKYCLFQVLLNFEIYKKIIYLFEGVILCYKWIIINSLNDLMRVSKCKMSRCRERGGQFFFSSLFWLKKKYLRPSLHLDIKKYQKLDIISYNFDRWQVTIDMFDMFHLLSCWKSNYFYLMSVKADLCTFW